MSSFFSAYRPSPWNTRRLLKPASAGVLALVVWWVIIQAVPMCAVPTLWLVGGLLWGCSMLGGFLHANKLALVLAASGAVLLATGVVLSTMAPGCMPVCDTESDGEFTVFQCY